MDCGWFSRLPAWHLFVAHMVRHRQRRSPSAIIRSRLGQFWLTLSMALSIAILSFIWALLWHVNVSEMLPYLAASLIFWQFMQGIATESSTLFSTSKHLLLGQRLPASVMVFAMLYKHFLILAHNLVILIPIYLFLGQPISWRLILLLPALLMSGITSIWMGYTIGILCAPLPRPGAGHLVGLAASVLYDAGDLEV
jgi:lipopolysaccharide transport system permease protein